MCNMLPKTPLLYSLFREASQIILNKHERPLNPDLNFY